MNKRVLVYSMAEATLREAGIGVTQLQGSWLAWEAAGLPVEYPPKTEGN